LHQETIPIRCSRMLWIHYSSRELPRVKYTVGNYRLRCLQRKEYTCGCGDGMSSWSWITRVALLSRNTEKTSSISHLESLNSIAQRYWRGACARKYLRRSRFTSNFGGSWTRPRSYAKTHHHHKNLHVDWYSMNTRMISLSTIFSNVVTRCQT